MSNTCAIWVCQDCMLHYANGECGNCHTDEGHDCEPWSIEDVRSKTTMGLMWEEHDKSCVFSKLSGPNVCTPESECDCETISFTTSSCESCGSVLHGERHAFTLWFED